MKIGSFNFNPRTREGCDKQRREQYVINKTNFNPRTREGCDMYFSGLRVGEVKFQSTHPRRVRPIRLCSIQDEHIISIHAPAKGATGLESRRNRKDEQFQSTHPRRVRRFNMLELLYELTIFQSTHPRRVRRIDYIK